jgi:hypothetical protein
MNMTTILEAHVVDYEDTAQPTGDILTKYTVVVCYGTTTYKIAKRYSEFKTLYDIMLDNIPLDYRFPNKSMFHNNAQATKLRRVTGFDELLQILLEKKPIPQIMERFLGVNERVAKSLQIRSKGFSREQDQSNHNTNHNHENEQRLGEHSFPKHHQTHHPPHNTQTVGIVHTTHSTRPGSTEPHSPLPLRSRAVSTDRSYASVLRESLTEAPESDVHGSHTANSGPATPSAAHTLKQRSKTNDSSLLKQSFRAASPQPQDPSPVVPVTPNPCGYSARKIAIIKEVRKAIPRIVSSSMQLTLVAYILLIWMHVIDIGTSDLTEIVTTMVILGFVTTFVRINLLKILLYTRAQAGAEHAKEHIS